MAVRPGVVPGTPTGLYCQHREIPQIRDGADQDRFDNEAYTRTRRVKRWRKSRTQQRENQVRVDLFRFTLCLQVPLPSQCLSQRGEL